MKTDQIIIDINDETKPDDRPVDKPVFSIESPEDSPSSNSKRENKKLWIWFGAVSLVMILCAIGAEISSSLSGRSDLKGMVSDEENIKILQEPFSPTVKGVVMTSDSVLGVALRLYPLEGLKASLEPNMPDTTDTSLVMFMRSADYHADKSMIGSVIVNGSKLSSKDNPERIAYLAIASSGRPVIGISSSDKVADFALKNNSSFFRQYPLLANGVLPPSFELHGKVPRAAIGKYSDEKLYYIVAPHNETMYGFADALREYGFSDVIYITGGDNYIFHRSPDGKPVIPAQTKEKIEKYTASPSPSPFLVFRNK